MLGRRSLSRHGRQESMNRRGSISTPNYSFLSPSCPLENPEAGMKLVLIQAFAPSNTRHLEATFLKTMRLGW